jgi:DNA polymerase-4
VAGIAEHILHVDMDAFFVEVERLADPSLVGVPVVVGGLGDRGVVAAASYEARAAGVRSAMPISVARRRLPHGRFIVPDRGAYRRLSAAVFDIFGSFSPLVEPISIDEAFIEIGGLGHHFAGVDAVATALRSEIRERLGLPASAGAATTKLVAKLASERAKPDGQLVVTAGSELEFLHPLDVRALWGVGEATHATLEALGVTTIGELAALPEEILRRRLGDAVGGHLHALAHNRDERQVEAVDEPKSISSEVTFPEDITDPEVLEGEMFKLCVTLSRRLRRAGKAAETISVKVRFADFTTVTRSHTGTGAVDLERELFAIAAGLVSKAGARRRPVRLLGVAASALVGGVGGRQLQLGGEAARALALTSDEVRDRFGDDSLVAARLIPRPDPERR